MIRYKLLGPKIELDSGETYSFLTGFNVYTGLGIYGIIISIFGFGFFVEYIKYGKWVLD